MADIVDPFDNSSAGIVDPFDKAATSTNSPAGLSSYVPSAISDVPGEVGGAFTDAADTAAKGLLPSGQGNRGVLENILDTGKGLLAIPNAIAAPVVGAARSLVGHPFQDISNALRAGAVKLYGEDKVRQAEQATGMPVGGETYQDAKNNVDLAMSAARPGGAPIKVGGAYEWQAPPASVPNLKPIGVVKQPETEDFFNAADNNYANMRGYGVEIDPAAMNRVADNIHTELMAEGYRPRNAPKTFDAIEELRNPAGQNHEISDIDSVRKVLGKARLDPSERDAARRAVGHIDDYLSNLGNNPQDAVVNPQFAGKVGQEAQEARANYAVAKRSEDIDEALDQAERQAARAGSGGNINNAIRQRLSALRNNKKKMAGWNDDEKAELDAVINGTKMANAARQAGKFAPHGIVSTVMSAGAGHAIAPGIGEVAVPAAGLVAKMVGDRMTRLAADRLQNVVKARSPLGKQTQINAAAQSALASPSIPKSITNLVMGSSLPSRLSRLYVSPARNALPLNDQNQ